MRVRIDVVHPHPGAVFRGELTELLAQVEHPRLHWLAVPEPGAVLDVDTVGARVLADHEQFLDAGLEQARRLAEHIADRPRHQVAAHARDDAERAAVVAAFADLEIRVMLGRELDAGRGHEVDERVVRLRAVQVHRIHHLVRRMRAGDGEHARVHLAHQVAACLACLRAETAGDDDLAVFSERLADRVQAFLDRVVDEAAGVDDHQVGPGKSLRGLVALGAQLGEDQLGIGEGLRAAQRDEADLRRGRCGGRRGKRMGNHRAIFADRL